MTLTLTLVSPVEGEKIMTLPSHQMLSTCGGPQADLQHDNAVPKEKLY